jgi:hypothetical protein
MNPNSPTANRCCSSQKLQKTHSRGLLFFLQATGEPLLLFPKSQSYTPPLLLFPIITEPQ